MQKYKVVTGIILAGGKSSRMGFDKGLAKIAGKTSIEHVVAALQKVTDSIIIISNNNSYDFLGHPIYKDLVNPCGPMGGIFTGLSVSKTKKNLIVACDLPFVTDGILLLLLKNSSGFEIVVPLYKNKIHPLCACYDKSVCKQFFSFILDNKLSIKKNILSFNYKLLPLDSSMQNELLNINTPEELRRVEKFYT